MQVLAFLVDAVDDMDFMDGGGPSLGTVDSSRLLCYCLP